MDWTRTTLEDHDQTEEEKTSLPEFSLNIWTVRATIEPMKVRAAEVRRRRNGYGRVGIGPVSTERSAHRRNGSRLVERARTAKAFEGQD